MKFKPEELRKYGFPTIEERLEHICVMLEKIVDGFGHPKVIVAGDLIDQPPWTKEYARIREENANLREQLRWHSVGDLPKKIKVGQMCVSNVVILKEKHNRPRTAYFSYDDFQWINVMNGKVIILGTDTDAKWCYIPDDNQGTDCTPEGE